jgi:hypothetical protein
MTWTSERDIAITVGPDDKLYHWTVCNDTLYARTGDDKPVRAAVNMTRQDQADEYIYGYCGHTDVADHNRMLAE